LGNRSLAEREVKDSPLVQALNIFSLELYMKLGERGKNLIFSPFSLWTALAMVYAGARAETEKQMSETLGFRGSQEAVRSFFRNLLSILNESPESAANLLSVANALWPQRGYLFAEEFLSLLKTHYASESHEVDFVSDVAGACQAINRWVDGQTRGRIAEIVTPSALDLMTRMVLTNAVYFKGRWDSPFEEERTRSEGFRADGGLFGKSVPVPMMTQTREFPYLKAGRVQVLDLPYQGKTLSMVILLPKRASGLAGLERGLGEDRLSRWLQETRRQKVHVFLPRFKMLWELGLARVLVGMGMSDAFDPERADFSGMVSHGVGGEPLFLSEAIHKAFIETDEEGTAAAAATAVVVSAAGLPPPIPVFRADHPFLFLIRDNRTGAILFMGRVADPSTFA
jgi:serpin B